jgi:hypothetical protein
MWVELEIISLKEEERFEISPYTKEKVRSN